MIAAPAEVIPVELLRFSPESFRTKGHFDALLASAPGAGFAVDERRSYGGGRLLMLWGPGAADRRHIIDKHVRSGSRVVCLDLAYWHRDTKFRISIDAPHPQRLVMRRELPTARLDADRVPIASAWNPEGPVLIAGIGRKARAQYERDGVSAWEESVISICRERWPRRQVFYRKKREDAPMPSRVRHMPSSRPIDEVLKGFSLVATWHSNVAVDAIRMGIPAVCRDGAASAVCRSEIPERPEPLDPALRRRFLGNLAWFQWSSKEAPQCWAFLREALA